MTTWTVQDVCDWMESVYPAVLAEDWDRVGLICGQPSAPVRKILLALDPVKEIATEAIEYGADMVITHHPLYLRGTWTVAADTPKGAVIHELITHNCALFNAHTNADSARGGVADALALAAGLKPEQCLPLIPDPHNPGLGLGRVGNLEAPTTLEAFTTRLANNLPPSAGGILVAGNPDTTIQKVAVSGGSGDSMLETARATGADVFVTADLRHHPASEHLEAGEKPALVVPTHWASEWVWLPQLENQLTQHASEHGIDLEVKLSHTVTEPWTRYVATTTQENATQENTVQQTSKEDTREGNA
ncbi:MAG: Nif3-like dinuclear metal center hexameric protein [Actinomycetaceae bacterium]|nr:Nif3-like dinuclear metal center hexameric protein [Actinomycetaceae bacterium]